MMMSSVSSMALLTLSACASRTIPADLGIPWGATVKGIVANPVQADGKLVTVSGEVNRVFGPRWFSIGGEGFDGGEELLIVGSPRIPALLSNLADSTAVSNDLIQVTGRVRFFDRLALEKELGEDFGGSWSQEYQSKPVLVMTNFSLTPRTDLPPMADSAPAMNGAPITDGMMIIRAPNRGALVGRSVALLNVKVQTVVGKNAFWVGPDANQQLFVVVDSTMSDVDRVRVGETISVAGMIQAMPSDLAPMRTSWSLSAANEIILKRETVYLQVTGLYVHRMPN
jgi:hypothetical protein